MKSKTLIKNLRHRSLHMIMNYTQTKFQDFSLSIRRDFHVQKNVSKKSKFVIPSPPTL